MTLSLSGLPRSYRFLKWTSAIAALIQLVCVPQNSYAITMSGSGAVAIGHIIIAGFAIMGLIGSYLFSALILFASRKPSLKYREAFYVHIVGAAIISALFVIGPVFKEIVEVMFGKHAFDADAIIVSLDIVALLAVVVTALVSLGKCNK